MITIFIGENEIDRNEAVKAYERNFLSAHGELSLFKIDAESAPENEFIDAILSVPLFSDKKLVKIVGLEKNKSYIELILKHHNNIPENCEILIVASAFDGRLKTAKDLLNIAKVRDYPNLDRSALEGWLKNLFSQEDATISSADISYLINRVGEDQQQLYNEAKKLALLKTINKDKIDAMTNKSLSSTVFNLLDAISAADSKKALQIFDEQISLGNEPLAILGMISWQLFNICLLFTGSKQMSRPELMQVSGMSPFVFRKTIFLVDNLNSSQIYSYLDNTINAEYQIKNKPVNARAVLKNLILNLASR
jgi:DNA polymerase-3 subunit delta